MKPKPREREYVVPLIRQNRWRPPAKKDGEGSRQCEGKSEEEVALEKEAAEAIMKGEVMSNEVSLFPGFTLLQCACGEDFQTNYPVSIGLFSLYLSPSIVCLLVPSSLLSPFPPPFSLLSSFSPSLPSSLPPSLLPSLPPPSIPPSPLPPSLLTDIQEAKLQGLEPQDSGLVVPLIMQNKPPVVEGREGDELADVELRPEQVTVCVVSEESTAEGEKGHVHRRRRK